MKSLFSKYTTEFGLALILGAIFIQSFFIPGARQINDPVYIVIFSLAGIIEGIAIFNRKKRDTLSEIHWRLLPLFPLLSLAYGWLLRHYFGPNPLEQAVCILLGHLVWQNSEVYAQAIRNYSVTTTTVTTTAQTGEIPREDSYNS
jgi:F0F1-type ATP synthase assembly protein I